MEDCDEAKPWKDHHLNGRFRRNEPFEGIVSTEDRVDGRPWKRSFQRKSLSK